MTLKKKVKVTLIGMLCLLIICLIPFRVYKYKDGGTKEYVAVLYKYYHWHFYDGVVYDKYRDNPEYSSYLKDGYWDRKEMVFFPFNYVKEEPGFFD